MFGRNAFPASTFFMVLLVALALLGVGYGLWSKVLYIDTTVATGYVDADFDAATTNDLPGTVDPGHQKDVATCVVEGISSDLLTVTITNAYPSYSCDVSFLVTNTGSIPVMVQAYNLTGVPAELDVQTTGLPIGTQIEPTLEAAGDLHVHVLQEAEEQANYSFNAAITLVQWNEFSADGAMALCEKVEGPWTCVPGGATGVLYFSPAGALFDFDFNAEGLASGTSYTLIYYPDPWPGNGLICLGSGTADADGDLHLVGSPEINADLTAAKIWLVLSADVNCVGQQMIDWHPADYLFEETLITYNDTGV